MRLVCPKEQSTHKLDFSASKLFLVPPPSASPRLVGGTGVSGVIIVVDDNDKINIIYFTLLLHI